MYSSKLFLVSIAALVALFVHSPTAVSAAAVEDRALPLCPAGQCCAGDIVGSLPSYVTAAFPAPKHTLSSGAPPQTGPPPKLSSLELAYDVVDWRPFWYMGVKDLWQLMRYSWRTRALFKTADLADSLGPKGQRKAVEEQKREEKITEAVTLVNAGKASYDIAAQKFGLPRSTVYHRHHALFNGRLPEIIPDELDDDPSDKENASPVTRAKRRRKKLIQTSTHLAGQSAELWGPTAYVYRRK
ncbi:hypothetical protein C8J57DRAFT_1252842 [Mycena rebaudengoi]|nr:hypothetical protein C8J57DRAFT_1252842 [Mycena rebaudengoi]